MRSSTRSAPSESGIRAICLPRRHFEPTARGEAAAPIHLRWRKNDGYGVGNRRRWICSALGGARKRACIVEGVEFEPA